MGDAGEDANDDLDDLHVQDWPDDPPEALELDEDPPQLDLDLLDVDEDDPEDDGLLDEPEVKPHLDALPLDDEPALLPWQTTARLPERNLELPAILDPGRPNTTWVGGEGPGRLVIELAGRTVVVVADVEPGEPTLRIGRDVLAGRFAITC